MRLDSVKRKSESKKSMDRNVALSKVRRGKEVANENVHNEARRQALAAQNRRGNAIVRKRGSAVLSCSRAEA